MLPRDRGRPTRKKKLKKKVAPIGDTKGAGEFRKAERHKKTPAYRKAVREAQDTRTPAERRARTETARQAPARPENKVRLKVAADRAGRKREIARSQAGKDTKGDLDLQRGAPERDRNVKEARRRVLKRSITLKPPATTLKAELEGKGLLAGGLKAAGEFVGKGAEIAIPGRAGDVILKRKRAGVLPDALDPAVLAPRLAKDALNLPAQVLPSAYVPIAGAVEALQGRPKRIKRLARDIDTGDPIYNLGAAAVEAVGGDVKSAKRRLKVAQQAAEEHPGFTLAEGAGVKGALGRGTGRVMRSGVTGKTLKRVASTTREPLVLEGTGVQVHREWSPDVITKAAQVNRSRGKAPRVTTKDIHRRVDERVSVTGLDAKPLLEEFAARSDNGKVRMFNRGQAAKHAAELRERTGHEFIPQNVDHAGGRQVLVPKVALDRLAEHGKAYPSTTAGKALQVGQDAFRKTVLTTSTSWAAGNVIEALLRTGLAKAGPRSYVTAHKVVKRAKALDPEKAQELSQRVMSGGHYSLGEKMQIRNVAEQFAGTRVEPLANALAKVWQTPGPKQAAQLWHAWTESVFHGTSKVESQFQKAMLGAEIRRSNLLDGHTLKLSKKAVDQAARGLLETNEQVRMGRAVDRAYGKYSKLSPSEKMLISHYSPFIPWFLNSIKFVTDVLPRDHPIAVGLTATAETATEEWRKEHGLDLFMKGAVPGWLQGSIPGKGGSKTRASRFTPFGAFGDFGGTLSSQVLPLASGPLMALKGLDWKGQRLDYGDGPEGEKQAHNALTAVGEFIDATIPVVSQAKRVGDKGAEAFNPFTPVAQKKKKKVKKTTSKKTGFQWSDQQPSGFKWSDGTGSSGSGGTWGG